MSKCISLTKHYRFCDDDPICPCWSCAAVRHIIQIEAENEALRKGAPLGPIVGAETIIQQELKIKDLEAQLATANAKIEKAITFLDGLGSALRLWAGSPRALGKECHKLSAELREGME